MTKFLNADAWYIIFQPIISVDVDVAAVNGSYNVTLFLTISGKFDLSIRVGGSSHFLGPFSLQVHSSASYDFSLREAPASITTAG